MRRVMLVLTLILVGCESSPVSGDPPSPTSSDTSTPGSQPTAAPTEEETTTPTDHPTPDICVLSDELECSGSNSYPEGLWTLEPIGADWVIEGGIETLTWNFRGSVGGTTPGDEWVDVFTVNVWPMKSAYDDGKDPECTIVIDASGEPADVPDGCDGCTYAHEFEVLNDPEITAACPGTDYAQSILQHWLDSLDGHVQGYRPCLDVCKGGPVGQAIMTFLPDSIGYISHSPVLVEGPGNTPTSSTRDLYPSGKYQMEFIGQYDTTPGIWWQEGVLTESSADSLRGQSYMHLSSGCYVEVWWSADSLPFIDCGYEGQSVAFNARTTLAAFESCAQSETDWAESWIYESRTLSWLGLDDGSGVLFDSVGDGCETHGISSDYWYATTLTEPS